METLGDQRFNESTEARYAWAAQRVMELERESKSIQLRQTPTDRIFGDALVRALAPTVENLRREEFGSPDPPFEDVMEAARWIEQTSKASLTTYREKSEERKEVLNEINKLAREYQIEIEYKSTLLPYHQNHDDDEPANQNQDDDEEEPPAKWVPTVQGSYLYRLAKETRRIAMRTGLPQDALVVHVLTGLKPIRFRARLAKRE